MSLEMLGSSHLNGEFQVAKRKLEMLFVRGDSVILVSGGSTLCLEI